MRRLLRLTVWLALAGCALCLIAIGWYAASNLRAQRGYEALRAEVAAPQQEAAASAPVGGHLSAEAVSVPPAPKGQSAPDRGALAALEDRNADFAFWLNVPGTPVDYPVMHSPEEPERYLHRDFAGARSEPGAPFLFADCMPSPPSRNLVVYGHHMRDGSMFACLDRYRDARYLGEHALARIDAMDWRAEYEAFAVARLDADEGAARALLLWTGPSDEMDAEAFIREALRRSLVKAVVEPKATDSFLTLVTCEYTHPDGRLAVFFVRRAA